jgi:hypothetical protein
VWPSGQWQQTVNLPGFALRRFESSRLHHRFGGYSRILADLSRTLCGSNSGVESQPSKLLVAGSNPVSRSISSLLIASISSPSGSAAKNRWALRLWLGGAVWVLPLWLISFPPMVDYPQQLAAASILRFYGDPVRALQKTFEIVLLRPQGLFEMVTASFALVMPIDVAGKLVVSLCLITIPPCVLLLCRRTGRPAWYALLALAVTYNTAFYWGFVDNLVAYPLVLLGVWLADRSFDGTFGVRAWSGLAALGVLFYAVHLELLLILSGAVGWLALVRRPSLRQLAVWLSSMVPGLAVGIGTLAWAHVHAAAVMTGYQQRLAAERTRFTPLPEKIGRVPGILFGYYTEGTQFLLLAILLAVLLILFFWRLPRPAGSAPGAPGTRSGDALYRTRFATLGAWMVLLFLVLPEFTEGYLVCDRILPLAFMLLVPGLPVAVPRQLRLAATLTGGLLLVQLLQTATSFFSFAAESAGLRELLDQSAPGQALAGLMYEPGAVAWTEPPVMDHFPAYYQVFKGGRVHFSFVQFFNSPVAYRPGQNYEEALLAEWNEWNPQKFIYPRHAGRYRYFLVRGGPESLAAAFGPYLRECRVRKSGRWFLVERVHHETDRR